MCIRDSFKEFRSRVPRASWMGVLYLFSRDGRVFCPPRYWDAVGPLEAGGRSGAQLSNARLLLTVAAIVLAGAKAFYLLESGDLCQEAPARGVLGSLFHKPQPVCRRAGT